MRFKPILVIPGRSDRTNFMLGEQLRRARGAAGRPVVMLNLEVTPEYIARRLGLEKKAA